MYLVKYLPLTLTPTPVLTKHHDFYNVELVSLEMLIKNVHFYKHM